MKEYVTLHYLPWDGDMLTPGEILPEMPKKDIERLLEVGAIKELPPVRGAAVKDEGDEPEGTEPDETEPEEAGEDTEEAKAEEAEEDEEEALEIDALDGVVAAPAEESVKSARRKGAKTK